HFVADAIAGNRSDKSEITDVDSKNRNASTAEPMRRLQECAVASAGDHQIRFQVPQVAQAAIEAALWRTRFPPLLRDALAIERCFQSRGCLPGVPFGLIDKNDDFADFHLISEVVGRHAEALNDS